MWGKVEQSILWVVTYTPLVLIMIFRFITSNEFFGLDQQIRMIFNKDSVFLSNLALEIYFILIALVFTVALYIATIKYYLSGYEKNIKPGKEGNDYFIRKIEKLSANDYSFFLLTLLLPLISLDHSSAINLAVSIMVVIYVIIIYVKTDAISVCPLFFFSGRRVYKGIISTGTKAQELSNPSFRKEVVIVIKRENISLNRTVRGAQLVGNVYYLTDTQQNS
ncbi:hypothetical protein [Bacillus horti]|nr:hypothetical protein [Bacillus horti]